MRGSDIAELRAFAAVVQHAGFARAARHLGLAPSALSQTIRQLEARLGVRLLNRTTRSVAPTPAGARLHERLLPALQEIEAATAEAITATGRIAGTLRINTLALGAETCIAPRLGRFHRAHPLVTLDIVVDDSLADIVAGRFDAGIRVGEHLAKDMIAVRLTPDRAMTAVAAPAYLARHGTPKTPADLHQHPCITWRFPGSGTLHRWHFEKRGKSYDIAVQGPLIANHPQLVVDAACQGLGIAYAYDDRIHALIAEGRLTRVLADWSPTVPGLFLYYPNRLLAQPALRAFIDCLLDRDIDSPKADRD